MTNTIQVTGLYKEFEIIKGQTGFLSAFKSVISPKKEKLHALKGISFEIKEGELIGFIGPNGAGKTTTLKCLSGLLFPTSGRIRVLGYEPFRRDYGFLKKISLIMGQKNQLWWDLPALDTFRLNKEIYEIGEKVYKKNLSDLVEILDVSKQLETPVRKLSLGQRMKMELIAALLHQPRVLFLDEPTIGLDVVMQKNIRDFISDFNRKYSSSVILTSHYMADVKRLCQRIIIINKGKIVYDGGFEKLIKKHAPHKIMTIILKEKTDPRKFTGYGKIKSLDYPKVILEVNREKSAQISSEIMGKIPVEEFNMEDPEVEEIIRQVFTGKKS